MKLNEIVYRLGIPIGIIILVIGFYLYKESVKSSMVFTSRYGGGSHQVMRPENVILAGSLILIIGIGAFIAKFFLKRKTEKIEETEAHNELLGRRSNRLKMEFEKLFDNYSSDERLKNECWEELVRFYGEKHRYYHTLKHIEYFLGYVIELKSELSNWNAVLFALYYHDIVYDPSKSDNEEQSASLAKKRMKEIGVDDATLNAAVELIIATKTHDATTNDVKWFIDCDLSILSEREEHYELYTECIRKEFIIFEDDIYIPGRIKVLQHFLSKEHIYQTESFRNRFEADARLNLKRELEQLQKFG